MAWVDAVAGRGEECGVAKGHYLPPPILSHFILFIFHSLSHLLRVMVVHTYVCLTYDCLPLACSVRVNQRGSCHTCAAGLAL